jgi:hypothetical protein
MTEKENSLLGAIKDILSKDPSRMFSREELLNLLAPRKRDSEVERLLAELEVSSSTKEASPSEVYATCRGGTVYYKWNRAG